MVILYTTYTTRHLVFYRTHLSFLGSQTFSLSLHSGKSKCKDISSKYFFANLHSRRAPQGCVLSPALLTLYTFGFRRTARDTLLVKFSDDAPLTGLITTSENSYRCAVEKLVCW